MEHINGAIDRYFNVDDEEKLIILKYIDKIKNKMLNWKKGGKIETEFFIKKIGRNDLCICGSGKKYKNCCGK